MGTIVFPNLQAGHSSVLLCRHSNKRVSKNGTMQSRGAILHLLVTKYCQSLAVPVCYSVYSVSLEQIEPAQSCTSIKLYGKTLSSRSDNSGVPPIAVGGPEKVRPQSRIPIRWTFAIGKELPLCSRSAAICFRREGANCPVSQGAWCHRL